MFDLSTIVPTDGQLPARPENLCKVDVESKTTSGALEELLIAGRVVVSGGISLLGEEGRIVQIISLMRMDTENERVYGWVLKCDSEPTLEFLDSADNTLPEWTYMPFPEVLVCFVGTTDEGLLRADAPQKEIADILRFVVPFIDAEGAPEGIDW